MGKHQNVASLDALANNRNIQVTDYVTLAFGDATVAKQLAVLPAGAVILGYVVEITTTFNAGTNDYLTIGTATDDDAYINDFDLGQAAAMYVGAASTVTRLTADTMLYALYSYTSTAPTTGLANVAVEWIPWGSRDE